MRAALLLVAALLLALPAQAASPRVAVLYFDNVGNPELDMLRLGLAEMMIVDLSNRPDLAVVERNRINQVLGELDLQRTDKMDPSKAVEIGKLLGAERMVLGSYFELLGTLTVTASVVEVETGQSIGGHKVQGQVAEFSGLLEQVTGGVTPALVQGRDWLQATPTPEPTKTGASDRVRGGGSDGGGAMAESAPAPEPDDAAPAGDPLGAALAFSEGLDFLDRKDLKRARDALQRAVTMDPGLDLAREELAKIKI